MSNDPGYGGTHRHDDTQAMPHASGPYGARSDGYAAARDRHHGSSPAGDDGYRAALDLYFDRHDGDAAVCAVRDDHAVRLIVRDHGPGVAPDVLPSLTRPFFRGDSARTAATGAGLGLAIVAKMVQNMGGSLDLSNSPSGGLMAVIRLQQAPEQRGGSSLLKKRRTGGTS